MSDETDLTLGVSPTWTETHFERGTFGPEDRPGFEATFELTAGGSDDADEAVSSDTGGASLSVLPVRYRRVDGQERVEALTEEYSASRTDPTAGGTVRATTAFAARAMFTPYERQRDAVVCVATDADDALAVAVWLATASEDARELGRNLQLHSGTRPPSRADPGVPDDDVLATVFADEPDRCLFTGQETRSHRVAIPYRYTPLLDGARETTRGVPRFPSTVRSLVGVVSHGAWEEHSLDEVDFEAPLERVEAGQYRLDPAVASAVDGADATRLALARLGEEP